MSKRKESTSTSTTRREVVTPTNPEWVTRNVQGLADRIGQLGEGDPYSLVAPASGLEQRAEAGANGLGRYGFGYDAAAETITMTGDVVAAQGQNVLRGERLVINVVTGQARMETPAASGRVRGVFYPNRTQGQPAAKR